MANEWGEGWHLHSEIRSFIDKQMEGGEYYGSNPLWFKDEKGETTRIGFEFHFTKNQTH